MIRGLALGGLVLLAGCGGRYLGWEQVRIVEEKPAAACIYKAQEACSARGADCYTWYKQRATTYGANVVHLTSQKHGQQSSSGANVNAYGGYAYGGSSPVLTALADYYACPAP